MFYLVIPPTTVRNLGTKKGQSFQFNIADLSDIFVSSPYQHVSGMIYTFTPGGGGEGRLSTQ